MASFTRKNMTVNVTMGGGSAKSFTQHAMTADIEKVGLPDTSKARITIYNMLLPDMEQLTTLAFKPLEIEKNQVQVLADVGGSQSVVFEGEIIAASADFNTAPDISFNIEAQAGHFPQLKAIPATASVGEIALADVLSTLCGQAGYAFVNEGVSATARDIYLTGSPIDQIKHVAREYDLDVLIDDGEVIAMPLGQSRKGDVVLVNKTSGLLGYPTFTSNGLQFTTIFNDAYKLGAMVQVESIVPKASGAWKITKLSHKLSNMSGGGEWLSELEVFYV